MVDAPGLGIIRGLSVPITFGKRRGGSTAYTKRRRLACGRRSRPPWRQRHTVTNVS